MDGIPQQNIRRPGPPEPLPGIDAHADFCPASTKVGFVRRSFDLQPLRCATRPMFMSNKDIMYHYRTA